MLSVCVEGDPQGEWARSLTGVQLHGIDHGKVRVQLDQSTSSDSVLAAAQSSGTVTHFSFDRRHLSEVFREAVKN